MRGTLRDQVRYPTPPLSVSRATKGKKWSSSASLQSLKHTNHPDDNRVLDALDATEIGYLVHRGDGLDQLQVPNSSSFQCKHFRPCFWSFSSS